MSLRPTGDEVLDLPWSAVEPPRPADAAVLAWCAAVAVLTDLAVRSGMATFAGMALMLGAATGMIASRRITRPQAMVATLVSALFASWLVVRASPWLIAPDVIVAVSLLVVAAVLESGADVFDLDLPGWLQRAVVASRSAAGAGSFLVGGFRSSLRVPGTRELRAVRIGALLRGLLVAVPILLVLGGLLRSADPVFASFIRVRLNAGNLFTHVVLVLTGAWGMGSILRLASTPAPTASPPRRLRLGRTEGLVVLVAVDCLFGLFALAQLVALSGAGDHVLRTAGLTYAEYARSGYFQLLWAAGLTLAMLLGLDAIVDRPATAGRLGMAGALAAGLTIVVAVAAFHRLALYEHAFGLTMLRLSCQVFAVWIIAVFALLAASLLGVFRRRCWFVGSALVIGLITLLAFNAMNPEAAVARSDLRRGVHADVPYLSTLSDDAVPTIAGHLAELSPSGSSNYAVSICSRLHRSGWASFNVAASRAGHERRRICRPAE